MPGLIEAHGHISFCDTPTLEGLGDIPPEERTLKTMKYAKVMLDQGFTAILALRRQAAPRRRHPRRHRRRRYPRPPHARRQPRASR